MNLPPFSFQFWDSRTNAIGLGAGRLRELNHAECERECEEVARRVTDLVETSTDEALIQNLVTLVDDLYKSAQSLGVYDHSVGAYLRATAGPFLEAVKGRGYVVNSVIDNTFELTPAGMNTFLTFLPAWFNAATLVYICPQALALRLMENIDEGPDVLRLYPQLLPRYIDEARDLATQLVRKCHEEGGHFIFLDIDSTESMLEIALSGHGLPGVLTVFRNEAPLPGTEVMVGMPAPAGIASSHA